MNTFDKIDHARRLLELPERASMNQIKSNFRRLIIKWHPDKNDENSQNYEQMTRRIIDAYKTILAYCSQYKYSFSREEINNYITEEEWWHERFGEI